MGKAEGINREWTRRDANEEKSVWIVSVIRTASLQIF